MVEAEIECPELKIIRIDGPLFFGAVNHVGEYLYNIDRKLTHKRNVLIVGYGINFIDVAGAEMLAHEAQRRRTQRGNLYLCKFKPDANRVLERGVYLDTIGRDHLFATQKEAITKISPTVDAVRCQQCDKPVFKQCPVESGRVHR